MPSQHEKNSVEYKETYKTGGPSAEQSSCPVKVQYAFMGLDFRQFSALRTVRADYRRNILALCPEDNEEDEY